MRKTFRDRPDVIYRGVVALLSGKVDYLFDKYNFSSDEITAVIGEYDDPAKQKQGLLKIDLTNTGNLLLFGIPGSGKENFVTTVITSICAKHSSDEVNIYIMDFGAETLGKFKDFPQVSDTIYMDEIEKLNSLYNLLNKEITKRKAAFSEYNGSYVNYISASEKKMPNIIVVIHQIETMVDNPNLMYEKFINLFKEGPKFGITFVVTNSLATGIRMKVLQLFPNKLTLKLSEDIDYRIAVEAPKGLVPTKYFGRGLAKLDETLEYQTAYISKPDEINQKIKEIETSLKALKMKKAPRIPTLPNFLTVDNLINTGYTLKNIPVGISKTNLSMVTYDFDENYVPILSNDLPGNIHFLYGLIELLKQIPNSKTRIIDVLKIYKNVQGIVYSYDKVYGFYNIKLNKKLYEGKYDVITSSDC